MTIEKRRIIFILNNSLEFDPEKRSLKRIDNKSNQEVKLNSPASDCLYLLLSNMKDIVSQNDFFKLVWEINGEFVSLNTLYQNISILRKCIKELGINYEVINTVVKKGFRLSSNIEVSIVEKKKDSVFLKAKKNSSSGFFYQFEIIRNNKTNIIIVLVLFLLLLGTLYQSAQFFIDSRQNIDYSYKEISMIDSCHIYTFNINRKKEPLNMGVMRKFIKESPIDCDENGYLYVNWQEFSHYYSIIVCNNEVKFNRISDCYTVFFEG